MNLLETLVYNLPSAIQEKALDAANKSDDCCTVNCESIEVIEDYIIKLQSTIKQINTIVTSNANCGELSVCDEELHILIKLTEL